MSSPRSSDLEANRANPFANEISISADELESKDIAVNFSQNHALGSRHGDPLQRQLKQRHIQMIALAGTIGTGLFLTSGVVLAMAGPLGSLLAYLLVSSVAYTTLCAVSELASYAPISGSFPLFAARWVDPALGFAIGWNYFYTAAIAVPTEISATSLLITFWDNNTNHKPIYLTVVIVGVLIVNFLGAKWFGETEFYFAIVKILMLLGLLLLGLIIDLGGGPNHERIGFQYWKNPGLFGTARLEPLHLGLDRFLAILQATIIVAFSFAGIEVVAVAASETENPRRNITKAVQKVFWRIFIFYILSALIIGMTVPYNDISLLRFSNVPTAVQSPFVIAMTRAGIKVLPSIINAGILTSTFSAANSFMFAATRILYGLGLRGLGPKFLAHCTKGGLPIVAIGITACFPFLAFMGVNSGSQTVFRWFMNLTTVGVFIGWWTINITFLRFYMATRIQGIDRKDKSRFAYTAPFQPYMSIWAIFWTTVFILFNGFTVFWKFNARTFVASYINIPIYAALYLGYKIVYRTKIQKLADVDLVSDIPSMEETETPEVPPTTIWGKIGAFLF